MKRWAAAYVKPILNIGIRTNNGVEGLNSKLKTLFLSPRGKQACTISTTIRSWQMSSFQNCGRNTAGTITNFQAIIEDMTQRFKITQVICVSKTRLY